MKHTEDLIITVNIPLGKLLTTKNDEMVERSGRRIE